MGSSPKSEVSRQKKWAVQVNYKANGHKSGCTLKGLDAPTESEVYKALKEQVSSFNEYTDIEIWNKWSYTE